eukprot:3139360-Pleurochrysis_carterae.AAC.2
MDRGRRDAPQHVAEDAVRQWLRARARGDARREWDAHQAQTLAPERMEPKQPAHSVEATTHADTYNKSGLGSGRADQHATRARESGWREHALLRDGDGAGEAAAVRSARSIRVPSRARLRRLCTAKIAKGQQ